MKIHVETRDLAQILDQLHFQEDQIRDLRDQVENGDRDLNRLECKIRDLNEKIRDLTIERDQYTQSLAEAMDQIKIQKDTIADMGRELRQLTEDNRELREAV